MPNLIAVNFITIEPLTEGILHRIPAIEKAEIRQMINGPDAFTADGHLILGEAPKVRLQYLNNCLSWDI